MIPDGRYVAVVDRVEDGRAVLLVEDDGELLDQLLVRESRLPGDARRADAVLRVMLRNGHLVSARHDPDESERRRSEAQSRFDRLAERPDDSDDES